MQNIGRHWEAAAVAGGF